MRTRLTLAAITTAIAVLLTACGGSGGSGAEGDLARVKDAGVLKVGTEGTYSPFSFHDPNGNKLVGYDVEVAAAVAKKLGVEVEYVETPWDSIFTGLTSQRFDDLFGGPPRKSESLITQREMDLAASIQAVTDEVMLRLTRHTSPT